MERNTIEQIIALLHKEVVPAIGCTEPVAVALASAKAAEVLGGKPEQIDIYLSANVLKNAMGVGIPGTGMVGLPIAVALGALIGRSAYGLEVLRDLTSEALAEGKEMIERKQIGIHLKENVDKLYIEAVCVKGSDCSKVIISHEHTRFTYIVRNEEILLDLQHAGAHKKESEDADFCLSFSSVYEFAMTTPLEDIRFILDTARLNKKAAEEAAKADYGHSVGRTVSGEYGRKYLGDSSLTRMLSMTSAACDVRMDGAMIPVMSNSGLSLIHI